MKRVLSGLVVVVVAALAVLLGRWYMYVTNTTDALDEVGISLNSSMPAPLNQWGCSQLKVNFGNQLPPYGCGGSDGTHWK